MAKISLGRTELDSSASAVVLGCPGSGKTSSIIELVAQLEQAGFAADEILVLTPSRLAANLLRDQLGVNSQAAAKAPRARSIQLALYRIGLARLLGIGVERIEAAFYFAADNNEVRPELVGETELEKQLLELRKVPLQSR